MNPFGGFAVKPLLGILLLSFHSGESLSILHFHFPEFLNS